MDSWQRNEWTTLEPCVLLVPISHDYQCLDDHYQVYSPAKFVAFDLINRNEDHVPNFLKVVCIRIVRSSHFILVPLRCTKVNKFSNFISLSISLIFFLTIPVPTLVVIHLLFC